MGKTDFATGNESVNPFDPPRQMAAQVSSLIGLLGLIQRRRKEPQTAVEVGVWQGQSSRCLLHALPYLTLHMVDPLLPGGEGTHWNDSFASCPPEQIDQNAKLVQAVVDQFAPRAIWHRELSLDVAAKLAGGGRRRKQFDLVFIDGAHDYASVKADIAAWLPAVRAGGWLCGHDWKPNGKYGKNVGAAVREFLAESKLRLSVWPGKVWAVRIPPYDRLTPICPNDKCRAVQTPRGKFELDHFEQRCDQCGGKFCYVEHPSLEYHCWA